MFVKSAAVALAAALLVPAVRPARAGAELPPRRPLPTCTVTMPDVMGQDEESALAELTAAQIRIDHIWVTKTGPFIYVVAIQTPTAGTVFNGCTTGAELYLVEG